ncbi:H-NS family nucleoid-associated regulatory protein [Paraburkholderia unamae]|uniref:H-NS family nucleoid-associated regulatory protein n=1 Tax=Paraburkholderia unamae TaxID=219649 RepID=UPI000DD3E0A2|nr:H-NS family nucleoid-associated regulatory protein [Paraburkholderia unamae]
MDERKRDSIISYLRHRMAEFGIEPEDVAASIAEDQLRQRAARYQNASGEKWDGQGEIPQWLVQAMSAGQSREHFAISAPVEKTAAKRREVNWADDPFAGSRLATATPERVGTL